MTIIDIQQHMTISDIQQHMTISDIQQHMTTLHIVITQHDTMITSIWHMCVCVCGKHIFELAPHVDTHIFKLTPHID